MEDFRIHEVINLAANGIDDEYGIHHEINFKKAHELSKDVYWMWGNNTQYHDEVLIHYGNTKPARQLTKKEWIEAHRDYRKYMSQVDKMVGLSHKNR